MALNHPGATEQALSILRSGQPFQWYVILTVRIPFFVVSMYSYDWSPQAQVRMIGALWAVVAVGLVVFAGILRWT
jgi:hypothetical protein